MSGNWRDQRDAAQAAKHLEDAASDERIHSSLHFLTGLQFKAGNISFLPRQPVHSLLSGRHASRVRGRGLNFEEIRQYHAGDDVRTIDWKVTARLRSPHTRVFTEERDRPVLLVIDQRIGMFFGTQLNMKSVTAAHVAALAAWRVLDAGDRIGAVVFNDSEVKVTRPHRSRQTVMRVLKDLVTFNQALNADAAVKSAPSMLDNALEQVCRLASHDYLVVVISDFHGFGARTLELLRRLRQHNDLLAALVHDPSASQIQLSQDFVVTDGELQVEVEFSGRATRQRLQSGLQGRMAAVMDLQRKLHMPVLPISSGEDAGRQLNRLLGRGGRVEAMYSGS